MTPSAGLLREQQSTGEKLQESRPGCRGGGDCPACPSRDLLGKEPQEKLEIRLCPDGSGQLYVPGLTEFQVQSVDDINKVCGQGASKEVLGRPQTQQKLLRTRTEPGANQVHDWGTPLLPSEP